MSVSIALIGLQIYFSHKVRKTARIRNRYNEVPHLSQNTKWESGPIEVEFHMEHALDEIIFKITTFFHISRDMWFPTMWYFDKCRRRQDLSLETPNYVRPVA